MDFIERLPNWLRWILVPVSSVLAMFIVNILARLFFWLQARFLGLGEGAWLELIWKNVLSGGVTGFAMVYIGVMTAPFGKKVVALVLGGLFVMLGGLSFLMALGKEDWWGATEVGFTIVGLGFAIFHVFEEEHKNSRRSFDKLTPSVLE
jgi:hypothetical protein